MLANIGKALAGAGKAAVNPQTYRNAYNAAKDVAPIAGKVAVPVGVAAGGTAAMNQAHKLGA
jgi:hypothetical protein